MYLWNYIHFRNKFNVSSTEAIYKTIVNNQKIIHNFRKKVDLLMQKAEEKRLRNITNSGTWIRHHKRYNFAVHYYYHYHCFILFSSHRLVVSNLLGSLRLHLKQKKKKVSGCIWEENIFSFFSFCFLSINTNNSC